MFSQINLEKFPTFAIKVCGGFLKLFSSADDAHLLGKIINLLKYQINVIDSLQYVCCVFVVFSMVVIFLDRALMRGKISN